MENAGLFLARHPSAVGVLFAAIAAYSAWNAYKTGMRMQELRELTGEAARAASEALGG